MDNEIKGKLDEFNRRFDDVGKRFDDMKWYITAISSIFPIIFGIVALVFGLNFSSEKTELRNLQTTLKEQADKSVLEVQTAEAELKTQLTGKGDSKIEINGTDGLNLDGQELPITISKFNPESCDKDDNRCLSIKWTLDFLCVIKNTSNYQSGPMYIKIYTKDLLNMGVPSSDEGNFNYEFAINPEELIPSSLTGKYSMTYSLTVNIENDQSPEKGRYPALIKIYYGTGKFTRAPIYFIIAENALPARPPPRRSSAPAPRL